MEDSTQTDNPTDTTNPTNNPSDPPQNTTTDDPPAPSTPPNNQPAPNVTEVLSAYQQELQAAAQRNRELADELAKMRAGPPKTPEQESQEYFSNPKQAVRDEIRAAVEPINDFIKIQQRNELISRIKANMAQAPGFEHLAKVEALFDQMIAQYPTLDVPTAVNVYNAAVGRFVALNGAAALASDAPSTPPANTTTRTNNPVNNPPPPHVRPSPPPVNAPVNGKDKPFKLPRPLNENEKKMARFNKMSDEEWWIETYEKKPQDVVKETK